MGDRTRMKFSIVFPSRERVPLLKRMLDSLVATTANLSDIEVLIAVDHDDKDTFEFLTSDKTYPFVTHYGVKRSLNFSRDYYTMLAHRSSGQWIITANDDCVFETEHWDAKAYEVLKDLPGVIYGYIEDGLGEWRAKGHGDYCCFPLQGRKGFEALGYIFPDRIPTWGADIWTKNLYDQIDSSIELPFTMRHYCVHNFTRESDHIHQRIARNQVSFSMKPTYDEINKLIKALRTENAQAIN